MKIKGFQRLLALVCAFMAVAAVGAQEQLSISDTEMALQYYQPLAEQGEPYAQLTIGEIYMEGAGVDQDMMQAYAWFAVALHQGVEEAEEILAHVLGKLNESEQAQAKVIAAQYIQHFGAH